MTPGESEQLMPDAPPHEARSRGSRRSSSSSSSSRQRWDPHRAAELRGDFIDSGRRRLTRLQWVGRGAETLLLAMIAFAALAFGAIEAWAQFVLAIGAVGLTGLVAVRCVMMRQAFAWSWLYLPVGLFVLLCLAQAWHGAPGAVVGLLSPEAASLWKSAGGAAALSVYPQATIDQLRIVLVAAAVFVCVANLVRTRWQAVRLLAGITLVGLVVASLAALQDLTFAKLIYWVGPPGRGLANAGPFVHYSHYGQFINLCMFAGLSWALVTLVRVQREFDLSPRDLLRALRDVRGRPVWLASALLLVGTCTLLYSTSRTATISFGVGLTLAILLTSRARLLHGRAWWVTPPLVLVFGAASVLGLQVAVERLSEMNSLEPYEQRKQIIADSVELWQRFPIVGTGLGTFEYVYPMVDRGTVNEVTTHAENEYVQLITETGVVGGVIAGAFLVGAGALLVRQLRSMRSSVHMATIGLTAALAATALHAFSDFALHMPVNALLVATLLGLLVALGRIDRDDSAAASDHVETGEEPADRPVPRFVWAEMVRERGPWIAWAILLVVTSVLLLPSSGRAWQAESYARSAYAGMLETEKMGWSGTDVQYARILKSMEDARAAQPGSAVYAYRHHLFIYWAVLRERGMSSSAVELSQVEVSYLARLAEELRRSRQLAPTYAPPVALLERVLRGLGRTEEAEALMDERHKLNRADGEASLAAARRAAASGDWAAADRLYRRAVERHADFAAVARDLVVTYGRPQLARDIAGKTLDRMVALRDVFREADKPELAERIELDRIDVMREAALDPAAEPQLLADLASAIARRGETDLAIDYYRRALKRDYGNLSWRVELISMLLSRNTPDAVASALDEFDVATRIASSPDDPRLRDVRERIRKVRAAATQPTTSPTDSPTSTSSSMPLFVPPCEPTAGHVWQGGAVA